MKFLLTKEERVRYLGFDDRLYVLAFVPLLVMFSYFLFTAGRPEMDDRNRWLCVLIGLYYTLSYWALNRYWIIWLRRRFPKLQQTGKRVVRMVAFAVGIVLANEWFTHTVLRKVLPSVFDQTWNDSGLAFNFVSTFILCAMVISIYESVYFFKKYSQSLVEREKLAKANMHAQLAALKQQVNPHFLFNSLNTLANVIPEDPQLATRFVQRLAAVYRRVLEYRHQELVTLEEELSALEDYLFLLKTRFEDKLSVELQMDGGTAAVELAQLKSSLSNSGAGQKFIPPLSLQLLLENAVKHNVVSSAEPLKVVIKVAMNTVAVSNQLNRRPYHAASTGLGQQNIQKRYELLTDRRVSILETKDRYEVILPLLSRNQSRQYATA